MPLLLPMEGGTFYPMNVIVSVQQHKPAISRVVEVAAVEVEAVIAETQVVAVIAVIVAVVAVAVVVVAMAVVVF